MLTLLFEDEYIIAVSKPNNILVHHSKIANNMSEELSLVELVHNQFNSKLYPIHRLDRKTSGIIIFAKKKEYVSLFQDLFVANKIQKTYLGLVRGFIHEKGIIDTPVKGRDANTYKEALTYFKRINTIELNIPVQPYDTSRYSLVELKPQTGRLHQLRIHMNKISHPLIGDTKYGDRFHNRMFEEKFNCTNMFLHAYSMSFIHPIKNTAIFIKDEPPCFWRLNDNYSRH